MLIEPTVLEIKNLVQDLWDEQNRRQYVYPTLADGVTVTAHPTAWTLGSFASAIPLGTIAVPFYIYAAHVTDLSVAGDYEMVLYQVITEIGRFSFSNEVEGLRIGVISAIANTQIRAKLACSVGGATAKIKLWYHL